MPETNEAAPVKLSSALLERSEIQKNQSSLKSRLLMNLVVQQGESAEEDPQELLASVKSLITRKKELMVAITYSNAIARINALEGEGTQINVGTVMAAIAERDRIDGIHRKILALAETSENSIPKNKKDVRFLAVMSKADLNKEAESLSRLRLALDTRIQEVNWTVDLVSTDFVMPRAADEVRIGVNLAEALLMRAELRREMAELASLASLYAVVQEGDSPAMDPAELVEKSRELSKLYRDLVVAINYTNVVTRLDEGTIMSMIAEGKEVEQTITVLQDVVKNAVVQKPPPYSNSTTQIRSEITVDPVSLIDEKAELTQRHRKITTALQRANWETELLSPMPSADFARRLFG